MRARSLEALSIGFSLNSGTLGWRDLLTWGTGRGFILVLGAGMGLGEDGGRLVGGEMWIGERSTEDLWVGERWMGDLDMSLLR